MKIRVVLIVLCIILAASPIFSLAAAAPGEAEYRAAFEGYSSQSGIPMIVANHSGAGWYAVFRPEELDPAYRGSGMLFYSQYSHRQARNGDGQMILMIPESDKYGHGDTLSLSYSVELYGPSKVMYLKVNLSDGELPLFSSWREAYAHIDSIPRRTMSAADVKVDPYITSKTPLDGSMSSWAVQEITDAIRLGFVPKELRCCYTDGINRLEFAKIAVNFAAMQFNTTVDDFVRYSNMAGRTRAFTPFTDCDDPSLAAAYVTGIVNGVGNNRFEPERLITREEAARMLANTYIAIGGSLPVDTIPFYYNDLNLIADWAVESVAFMFRYSVMLGVGDNLFEPYGTYTREQCIATFLRLYRNTPVSRNNGIALLPYNFNSLLNDIYEIGGFRESARFDTDEFVLVAGLIPNPVYGYVELLRCVYRRGGVRDIAALLPYPTPDYYSFAIEEPELNGNVLTVVRDEFGTKVKYAINLMTLDVNER